MEHNVIVDERERDSAARWLECPASRNSTTRYLLPSAGNCYNAIMVFQQGKDVSGDAEFQVAFPLEIVIGQTPLSAQAGKSAAKERWKNTVGTHVRKKIAETADWTYLDDRPLMATIYYFPPSKISGDIDNIVKLILDGMKSIAYLDDNCIERVVVQKFEPDVEWRFLSPSPSLEAAITMEKPALYIRVEDNLSWREAS